MCYDEPFCQVYLEGFSINSSRRSKKKVNLIAFNRNEKVDKVAYYAHKA